MFFRCFNNKKNFEKSRWTVTREWSEVTQPSADCQTTFFSMFQAIQKTFEKSRWTVTRQRSEVTQPSAVRQTTFFGRFRQFGKIWKKSLNGHATVVRGHLNIARLSNNVYRRFKQITKFLKKVAIRSGDNGKRKRDHRPPVKRRSSTFRGNIKNLEKSRRTVRRQWSEVTQPSADCQTTFFRCFKQLEKNLEKSRWTVTRQCSEFTRPSADCQTTFFGRLKQFGRILKKVDERSCNSDRRSGDRRLTVKQRFWTFQANRKIFEKSRWTVTQQWSEVTRPSAGSQTTFFVRFKQFGKILKQSLNGHARVVGGHATFGRHSLSTNVFMTFQAIWETFEKSRRTVTRQWSKVTQPSADCQTTFFGRFKQFGEIMKKDAERSRDSDRRSRDHRPPVKQRFLDVSSF